MTALIKYLIRILKKISNYNFYITVPIPGVGCGVLGLVFAKQEVKLGKVASNLLKSLEYRGYDSTGAIIQDDKKYITLRKDVGAPSDLIKTLGIEELSGKLFCGQVRWATFGSVTRENSQPHEVNCKKHIYGAHNGNITNTRELKEYLLREGHIVISDNDGEMLVHVVEQFFNLYLSQYSLDKQQDFKIRRKVMRKVIIEAAEHLEGSYAAVIVDPVSEYMWAIKSGSSLYVGVGEYEGNSFTLASSDLTAVLKYTKNLIRLFENEFVEFNHDKYSVFSLRNHKITLKNKDILFYKVGQKIDAPIKRSKLRVEDTTLNPPFHYYMHQEIYATINSSYKLVGFFSGGTEINQLIAEELWRHRAMEYTQKMALEIVSENCFEEQVKKFVNLCASEECKKIKSFLQKKIKDLKIVLFRHTFREKEFNSKYASVFLDIYEKLETKYDKYDTLLAAKILDTASEQREIEKFKNYVSKFVESVVRAWENHANIYTVSAGTSFNACKTAALFFNEIAEIEIIPILPGNFRGQYSSALRNHDVLIGVSQSGETKDLVDIFNEVEEKDLKVAKIGIVNNENSTLAQEKSDYYLPIKCGPEIAVPATKSYINQVILFYFLAIEAAKYKAKTLRKKEGPTTKQKELYNAAKKRKKNIFEISHLIEETLKQAETPLEKIAESLYLEPSAHILATRISSVAEEGALKIRETVLNHTQGIEGAEFKHGPNTILGTNTILGLDDIERLMQIQADVFLKIYQMGQQSKIKSEEIRRLISATTGYLFHRTPPFNLSSSGKKIFKKVMDNFKLGKFLDNNYPLIYITGPNVRDVNLTISQINTHKIRGASTFIIAEENSSLLENASTPPDDKPNYRWGYIKLPKTGDTLLTTFSSMVVLQLLSLKMSVKKMKYLNKIKIPLHGVHPDVPKNVSKSITVD
ncbi:MAG: SIS domain-containing protein [Calditrichia bacterium]|nr:SIS domain-containing protein [Calditrichia bacterium]